MADSITPVIIPANNQPSRMRAHKIMINNLVFWNNEFNIRIHRIPAIIKNNWML